MPVKFSLLLSRLTNIDDGSQASQPPPPTSSSPLSATIHYIPLMLTGSSLATAGAGLFTLFGLYAPSSLWIPFQDIGIGLCFPLTPLRPSQLCLSCKRRRQLSLSQLHRSSLGASYHAEAENNGICWFSLQGHSNIYCRGLREVILV